MIDITALTYIHTALSFIGLALGVPAVLALMGKPVKPILTTLFLVVAFATTATGFIFPLTGVTPAVGVGLVVTFIFAVMFVAHFVFKRAGWWKLVYDMGIFANVYFLVFVAIAQAFLKVPALYEMAPTQSEPPFAIAQIIAFGIFVQFAKRIVPRSRPH